MELQRYLTIVRRWVWLLVLGVVLGALGGFIASSSQTPVYQASTRFVILRAAQSSTSDYYSYLDSQQLIKTYIQLLTTADLMNAVSGQIGSPVEARQANASQIQDTQFVLLTVTDTNAERAAIIANALVKNLIKQNEELQAVRYVTSEQNLQSQSEKVQAQINSLQTQITDISSATVRDQVVQVQTQIDDLQSQITELQNRITELGSLVNPTDEQKIELLDKNANLAQLQPILALYQQVYTNLVVLGQPVDGGNNASTQLSQLQTTLGLYQQIYVSLLSSLENVRLARAQNTPNVVQVEVATTPLNPIRPQPLQSTLLAAAVGLMLAAGIAFLVEYLDDTLKTPEDVERELNLRVIGLVADMNPGDKKNGNSPKVLLHVAEQPRSPVSEAFRTLRTNLEFSDVDRPLRVILVTSAGPAEGKSTVAANLAQVMSQGNKRVILLDADLRRPSIHRQFDIPNRVGLSDVLRGKMTVADAVHRWSRNGSKEMGIVTSGSLPPNPAELLGSEKMGQILDDIKKIADIVVIDSPPMLVADAQVLSPRVDGILFVIQPGTTHIDSARTTVEQLSRVNARLLGVVMNRIPRNRGYYYGGYRHYSPYYYYTKKNGYSAYGSEESNKSDSAAD
jgi:capsular exopolysaccharide synthesis family protein